MVRNDQAVVTLAAGALGGCSCECSVGNSPNGGAKCEGTKPAEEGSRRAAGGTKADAAPRRRNARAGRDQGGGVLELGFRVSRAIDVADAKLPQKAKQGRA